MASNAVLVAGQASKLIRREEVAEGTMAFHFEKPSGFNFKAGQSADVTLTNPPETDAEGNTRTFSIASPPFEKELVFTTRMRDTAFKHSLRKVPLATEVKIGSAAGSFTLHKNPANRTRAASAALPRLWFGPPSEWAGASISCGTHRNPTDLSAILSPEIPNEI